MKTILLISPYWKEKHRWMVSSVKLSELWQKIGYRVVVVCMGNIENGKIKKKKISDTCTLYQMQDFFLKDPWNYGIAFGFTGYVRHIIREEKPEYIVVNKILFWTSLCVIPLRLSGYTITVLTDAFVGITWWPRGLIPRIGAFLYAYTFGWLILLCAKSVVLFHPQSPRLLKKLGISHKTQIIPTGIDSQKWKIGNHNRKQNDEIVVSYVGRLESIKGVDDFLATAVSLKKDFPYLKVQVIGWYKEGHPLVQQYQRDVVFTGLRKDIDVLLSSTDIFVMPSHSEGLSNAVMEAMASGCSIIATDVGGNGYLIRNGISGFLYPAGDRAALTSHIKRLIDDPSKRKAMGEAARKRIEEIFDWKIVGKSYEKLFSSMKR